MFSKITMKFNKIYNIDCLEGLRNLDDGCIDLIITSPPYNLGNNHHTGSKQTNIRYEDNLAEDIYQDWQTKILNECFRVLGEKGSLMYQHKNRIKNGIQISPYEWIFKTNFIIKQEIVWINGSQNFDKIRFYPFTERVYWLTKSPDTKLVNTINKQDVFSRQEWKPVGTNKTHTRAFPERLVYDLISVFPDSKIIMDPFMGSGTVAYVAQELGKKFIGFELDKTFFDLSNERLKNKSLFSSGCL